MEARYEACRDKIRQKEINLSTQRSNGSGLSSLCLCESLTEEMESTRHSGRLPGAKQKTCLHLLIPALVLVSEKMAVVGSGDAGINASLFFVFVFGERKITSEKTTEKKWNKKVSDSDLLMF